MIDDGRWPAGHQVPPERELARQYGVSLITIRRALDELARDNASIAPAAAARSSSPAHRPRPRRAAEFSEEMQRRGLDPQTRLIAARPESAAERVAGALEIEPGSPTLFIERLRTAPTAIRSARAGRICLPSDFRACWAQISRRLALCPAERALRHARGALARDIRAGRVALARGRPASSQATDAGLARRGHRLFR